MDEAQIKGFYHTAEDENSEGGKRTYYRDCRHSVICSDQNMYAYNPVRFQSFGIVYGSRR